MKLRPCGLFIGAASHTGQKGHFFENNGTKNFITTYSIHFLNVLYQNKALHNFHEKGAASDCQMLYDLGLIKENYLLINDKNMVRDDNAGLVITELYLFSLLF